MGLISGAANIAAAWVATVSAQAPQEAPAAPVSAPAAQAASPATLRIPATTIVDIEIMEPLSSKTSKMDAMFPIRLAAPVMVDGREVIPAGTTGVGQVVHAAKAGGMGKAGELLLAARYLELNGSKIPLRRFRLGGSGKDKTKDSHLIGAAVGILPTFFIKGGEVEFPTGTRANAIVAADTELSGSPQLGAEGAAPTNP